MSHEAHDEISTHGLADGCARCAEMAEAPLSTLDRGNLRDLIERTCEDRFGKGAAARSHAEARAMAVVLTALERTGQLFAAAPDACIEYLDARWRVVLEKGAEL